MTSYVGQDGILRPIGNRPSNPEPERGFALLFVLLTASLIAISLYIELPRIAFETQRNREQLLVDRGHEYQRAVQLFVRANKRYPTKIEDLEKFNDKRYLRHRFIDPLTMKDDWRFVHVGPTGMLTDSLVPKNNLNNNPLGGKDQNKDQSASAAGIGTAPGSNDTTDPNNPNNPGVGLVSMKGPRPSDTMVRQLPPMGSSGPGGAVSDPSGQNTPIDPTTGQPYNVQPGQPYPVVQPGQPYPGVQPGQPYPGVQPGQPYPVVQPGQPYPTVQPGQPYPTVQPGQPYPTVQPGQPYPVQPYPGQQPGQPYPVGVPGQPGQPYPGQPGAIQPGQPYPVQPYPGQPVQPYPGQPGQPYPGQTYPGGVPVAGQPNPAIIQPNPQFPPNPNAQTPFGNTPANNPGLQAVQQAILNPSSRQGAFANPGQQGGGLGTGIAGVGVPAEIKGSGIMVVKERSKYREWEFIYDPKEDKTVVGAAAAAQNQAGGLGQTSGGLTQTPSPTASKP